MTTPEPPFKGHSQAVAMAHVVLDEVRRVLAEFDQQGGDPLEAVDEIADIVNGA